MDKVIPKKSLGQHWLNDVEALQAMVTAVAVTDTDTVLEIGPGLGTLTKELISAAKQVVAVEFDRDLARDLTKRVSSDRLQIIEHDILSFDFTSLPPEYKVVANIPYYLTSNLLRVLSESSNPPSHAALLMQKEVAERVCARPGAMSILSVTAQYYWQCSLGRVVEAELFTPPPKVDSQILILQYRQGPLFADVDTRQFFRLVKAGFSQKRKTLGNALSAGLAISKDAARALLAAAGIPENTRAQSLSLTDWHRLYQAQAKTQNP